MLRRILCALALVTPLISGGAVWAQTADKPAQPETLMLIQEGVLLTVPAGWREVSRGVNEGHFVAKHLPANESLSNWTRMITVQTYRSPLDSAAQYLDSLAHVMSNFCDPVSIGPLITASADGYEAAMRETSCGRVRGDDAGEYMLHKAIKGQSSFFVVQWSARLPPFDVKAGLPISKTEFDNWVGFMQTVRICRMDDSDRACIRPDKPEAADKK